MADFDRKSMLEMFIYEMSQLLEQLETNIIEGESGYTMERINEIFRIMHTIKGSAAMMLFDNISTTAHAIEDLFYFLREGGGSQAAVDYSKLTDHVLEGMDFIKTELGKIEQGQTPDGDGSDIIVTIKSFLSELKGDAPGKTGSAGKAAKPDAEKKPENVPEMQAGTQFECWLKFEEGSEMENIRAYSLIHNLQDTIFGVTHEPEDLVDEESALVIREKGFTMRFSSYLSYGELFETLDRTIYLKDLKLTEAGADAAETEAEDGPNKFSALLHFEDGCEMENIRAFTLLSNIKSKLRVVSYEPENLIDEASIEVIKRNGFTMNISTPLRYQEVHSILSETIYLKSLSVRDTAAPEPVPDSVPDITVAPAAAPVAEKAPETAAAQPAAPKADAKKNAPVTQMISVNVGKLDTLLNLMGELVIAEAMVIQNPELEGLELESFHKEARQLRKIINDVQDTVMSMRMVPLQSTFFKMHRIVRDMCKQLNKDVELEVLGEDTEVDKNIIEHISDPLMHIIRNAIDHGIEKPAERTAKGKPERGRVLLEAKNSGGDVLIIIKDDGAGLKKERIMEKAKNNGLLKKPESEYTDKEIHQFIFMPGFSTNEQITNFSGRGVGMDVVSTNLEVVGGSVLVESAPEEGSTFTLKIPSTLAIIEGMTIKMGDAKYTVPIISILRSFKAKREDVFFDPAGNEMIRVRGEVYNVVRLYEFFHAETNVTDIEEGIIIMLENSDQTICLFVDELIGEQQVVMKSMPKYIKRIKGISGCTLLGNGDISLIIDVAGFFDK